MPEADPFAVVPKQVTACGFCAVCGSALVRTATGWVCPAGLDHTKIRSDADVAEELERRLPHKRPEHMSPHQWGWYRSRRSDWAARVMNELRRRKSPPTKVGGGSGRKRVKGV